MTGVLSGCSGRIPGAGPARIDATRSAEENDLSWEYPPTEGDDEGIGYAAVEYDGLVRRERLPPAMRLECNSTIGGIASSEPYRGYEPDWFRFRFGPPAAYEGSDTFEVRVQPPGQWEGFGAYYEFEGATRWFVIELRNVGTQGTILVPAVFDPGAKALPDRLHCSFAVRASRPGALGRTVRVDGRGVLDLNVG